MNEDMKTAVKKYVQTGRTKGWEAAEPILEEYKERFKDFEKWALAARAMIRVEELLEEKEPRHGKRKTKIDHRVHA